MPLFYPDYFYRRIYDIPTEFFLSQGIRAVLIDVDNTLTTHNNPVPHERVLEWLDLQRQAGIGLLAFSNNDEERVAPFACGLGLGHVSRAAKPLPFRLRQSLKEMGVRPDQAAVIGDQVFTDILCARLAGCTAVLVEPMEPEGTRFFAFKRRWEKRVLRSYKPKTWEKKEG